MDFCYAEQSKKLLLPQLALAFPLPATFETRQAYNRETSTYAATVHFPPNFRNPDLWLPIFHQTAGLACAQHAFMCYPLEATAQGHKLTKILEQVYAGSCLGMFPVSLDEIINYRLLLKKYDLDCNESYSIFQEGIYPIDLTPDALSILASDDLPNDLQDLFAAEKDTLQSILGSAHRLRLWVIGTNCD